MFFLNCFLPYLGNIKDTNYEDFYICLSQLMVSIEIEDLKNCIDIEKLMSEVVKSIKEKEIIEDR